jgi:hypothetical protein
MTLRSDPNNDMQKAISSLQSLSVWLPKLGDAPICPDSFAYMEFSGIVVGTAR